MFMLLEDQYGVGDIVDLGSANGTVEAVGLRITTVRDGNGTVWYVRNGEILRVGNKSQGFAVAVADLLLAPQRRHRAGHRDRRPGWRPRWWRIRRSPSTCSRRPRSSGSRRSARRA